ncbi:MAG: protein kinase [Chloroflexi bacterium]|nr:protein kinase [Chloroflexota bacterium]
MDDLSGQVIKGYELRERIGAGGFGAVYRAFQPAVGREVAVKAILPAYVNHPEFIRRFEAEAQLVARLEHLHIVPLYDYWREPQGAYLVMRYLRGGSLRTLMNAGPIDPEHAARLLDQVASALSAAHRYGVIHRDLKPDNVLLDEDGNGYLADFGIAKDLRSDANVTQPDTLIGSPAYFSPELIQGEALTARADIYSLGIVLYEMLAGEHPFPKAGPTTLMLKHLKEPLPELELTRPELTIMVNQIVQRATAKNPQDRYADPLEMAADLRRALYVLKAPAAGDETPARTRRVAPLDEALLVGEVVNPYKGLRAFQEADAADFNGREKLVTRLLQRLGNTRFLAVVGPSGSGKSSVVRAGVIPALRGGALPDSQKWFMVEMLPGAHPLEELEAALLRVAVNPPESLLAQLSEDKRGLARAVNRVLPADGELLLLIDQFEEIFTLVEEEDERKHIMLLLLAATSEARSRLRVIITLRADFYDRPLLYPDFGELMRQQTEVVLPLTTEELEHAIRLPAERVGLHIEPTLVETIIADVRDQPGALPLLQYALTELYERREGRKLTLEAYSAIGGTLGALARRAEQLFSELDADGQAGARQLFLRLVTLGEGAEDTRRRVLQSELLSLGGTGINGTVAQIIERFGKYRLLTFDSDPQTRTPTVEVAHEALIRRWARLREWLLDSREDLRIQRTLAVAAEEWLNSRRDHSFLARGARLDQLELWAKETTLVLNTEEQEYLNASIAEREAQRAAEAARQAREDALEKRSRQFLQSLVVVMALATVIAFILTGFAATQSRIAQDNAGTATVAQGVAQLNAEEAQSLALASSAQLALSVNNTELALALATSAERFDLPLVQRALYETAYTPGIRRRLNSDDSGHSEPIWSAVFTPNGAQAITGGEDHRLIMWDLLSRQILREFSADDPTTEQIEGHSDWVRSIVITPDGARALSASADGTLIVWDIASGALLRQMRGHAAAVNQVVLLPGGARALSASEDGTLILWTVETGEVVRRFGGDSPLKTVAVSPDGSMALSGDEAGVLTMWNITTGAVMQRYQGHDNTIQSVVYAPDGLHALSGSSDRTVIYWDLVNVRIERRFEGHSDWVWSVALSPDGRFAVSGSEDSKLILWDVNTGELIRRFEGHTSKVYTVSFSPDGSHLLSSGYDHNLIEWDVYSGAELGTFVTAGDVNAVAYRADGQRALSASSDGTLTLWDMTNGLALIILGANRDGHSAQVWTVEFSPDGRYAVSGSNDATAIVWDVDESSPTFGQVLQRCVGHGDWINDVTFSPDGRTFLSASGDTTLILWDVATGQPIRRYEGHSAAVTAAQFMPDSRRFISSSYDLTLILWDVESAQIVRTYEGGHIDRITAVALTPDQRFVMSAANDTTLVLWDVEQGTIVRRFREHTAAVYGLAISPDGQTALSASADNTLIRWDISTGTAISRYTGHNEPVAAVAYSPDGHTMLSGSYDDSLILWRLDSLDALLAWTNANRYVRTLTCPERERYNLAPCDAEGRAPQRTPLPSPAPTRSPSATPTIDLTRTSATPPPTVTLTLTPLPSATPTVIPPLAQPGTQRGFIPLGDRDAWRFEGRAGQIIIISLQADRPANEFSLEEREARDLLDTLLVIRAPDGTILGENDDIADGVTDSRLDNFVLPMDGIYIIEARSYGNEMDGDYTLVIEIVSPAP